VSVFWKEYRRICPEEVFLFTHDFVLLLLCEVVSAFVMNGLAAVGPLTMSDLKKV
jgi:hypothetical protein